VAQNRRHGRAFLAGVTDVPVFSDCVLVLVHPRSGVELRLDAQTVMVSAQGPMPGPVAGLKIVALMGSTPAAPPRGSRTGDVLDLSHEASGE
jgi:hypothetical protein